MDFKMGNKDISELMSSFRRVKLVAYSKRLASESLVVEVVFIFIRFRALHIKRILCH